MDLLDGVEVEGVLHTQLYLYQREYLQKFQELHDCGTLIQALHEQDTLKAQIEQSLFPLLFKETKVLSTALQKHKEHITQTTKAFQSNARRIRQLISSQVAYTPSASSKYRNFEKNPIKILGDIQTVTPILTNIMVDLSQNDKIIRTQPNRVVDHLEEILHSIFINKKLQTLHFNISFAEIEHVPQFLSCMALGFSSLTQLQHVNLDLSYTRLQSLGDLSKGFKVNNTMKSLHLKLNNTNVDSLDDLMRDLGGQCNIYDFALDVSHSRVRSLDNVGNFIRNLKELRNFSLALNSCPVAEIEVLSSYIKGLRYIKHLALQLNGTLVEDASQLLLAVGSVCSLTELVLDFSNTPLSIVPKIQFTGQLYSFSFNLVDTKVELPIRKRFRSLNAYNGTVFATKGRKKIIN